MNRADIIIVGAGISGLLCATELKRAGLSVLLFDKGRGFGGRMACRRIDGGRFDHGAQYFTVRDARFQAYVDQWLEQGIIKEWFRKSRKDSSMEGYPRYCGVNGMTDVPKYLGNDLEVIRSARVEEVAHVNGSWIVKSDSGVVASSGYLVLTAPIPQSLGIMDTSGLNYANEDLKGLREIKYERGLAILAVIRGETRLSKDGYAFCDKSPLTWIADNKKKGISEVLRTITIHADAAFAEAHWDSPNDVRGPLMLKAAAEWVGEDVVEYNCHRWGYTTPINPWHEKFYENPDLRFAFAGDAFGGPRIENAALSAIECAQAVIQNCGISLRGS